MACNKKHNEVVLVDFDDSFTWNIVAELEKVGLSARVVNWRTFKHPEKEPEFMTSAVMLGPGFGIPSDYKVWQHFAAKKLETQSPLFGICLGHQLMALAAGFCVRSKKEPWHGLATSVDLPGWLIPNLSSQKSVQVQWYNSWEVADQNDFSSQLVKNKWVSDGAVIGLELTHGLSFQFHPESIGTSCPEVFFQKFAEKIYNRLDETKFHPH